MAAKKKSEETSGVADAPSGVVDAPSGYAHAPSGYAEAMAEIEKILGELDSPSIDVDVLASKVSRASELIAWCHERITAAEFTVQTLVASLDFEDEDIDDDDFEDGDIEETVE